MLIKNSEVINILNGLMRLETRTKLIKGDGGEKSVVLPSSLSAVTRMTIARNISALRPVAQDIQKTNETTRNAAMDARPKSDDETEGQRLDAVSRAIAADIFALMESESDVEISLIRLNDLRIDENEFAPSVLSALLPIIE